MDLSHHCMLLHLLYQYQLAKALVFTLQWDWKKIIYNSVLYIDWFLSPKTTYFLTVSSSIFCAFSLGPIVAWFKLFNLYCSYAAVIVDINNHGEDAFKPELYGSLIILERRISESSSSTVLKDQHGIITWFILSIFLKYLSSQIVSCALFEWCFLGLYLLFSYMQ